MPSPGKGRAMKTPARARRVARKEKKATQAKVMEKRQQNTHDSMENVETVDSIGHKASDCWYKQTNKSQVKGKGTGKSKSKVTEISESDNSKQVDDWNPSSNTSAQQPNLSQVNTIGCADEGLWIYSLGDSKKRRYSVNWEDQSCSHPTEKWKTEEHELMIDSGCFGHRGLPTLCQRTTWHCNTTDKKWCTGT